MHYLAQYVLVLTTLSMIIGIILSFFQEGTIRKIIKTVSGVVLTIAAISPLTGLSLPDLDDYITMNNMAGSDLAAAGKNLADEAKETYIQQHLESYILDKASVLDVDITPTIELNEQGIPVSVTISGLFTKEDRKQIADTITNDLGIPEEDQKWTGEK